MPTGERCAKKPRDGGGFEPAACGPYTDTIGRWTDDEEGYNVAIRILVMGDGDTHANLGVGSAIVVDSVAEAVWRETLGQGAFEADHTLHFDLIETMRFDPIEGIVDLDRHLARLTASATALGFQFDRHAALSDLSAATVHLPSARRLRLRLSPIGATDIELQSLPPAPTCPVDVAVVKLPVASQDFRLAHKTSDRCFYDRARTATGYFEVLFIGANGLLTEGSFTNLFVERHGTLVTPPLALGLLPGVLRARLIDEGRAVEGELRTADLSNGFLIGNALRGLMPARLAGNEGGCGL